MTILHITSEFTKKNFSIASLIVYISNYLHSKFNINFSILASHYEKELFDNKNTETIKFDNFFNFFFKTRTLRNKILNYEIIHIHGIWAPIQVISIVICNLYRKNYVVHPHGMLLHEALKSTGSFKYILKKLFLFFFKYLISDKAKFLAITNQEYNAIKFFFPSNKINIISNPIPFKKQDIKVLTKKKQFVYFGRVHPHKNIDLIIKAFKASNLGDDWKLKIYGIKDDLNYLKKLERLIQSDRRIEIHEPIFGKEKQLILNQSWMNILVSKSEVLSLSILEAGMCSLPSLVNKNIELTNFENYVVSTNASVQNIKNELETSSNWSINERLEKGNRISQEIDQINSIDKISLKYNDFYQEFIKENDERNFAKLDSTASIFDNKNFVFLILTGNYTFNLLFTSFVVIALVIFGHFSVAGELGLASSFWITITQVFSSNMRSIVISENKIGYALITMVYRLVFSIFVFVLIFFLTKEFIIFDSFNLVIAFSILILAQWIFEMYLAICEIEKKYFIFKFLSIINLITSLTTIFLLYLSEFNLLIYLIASYILIIIITAGLNYFPMKLKSINFNLRTILKINIQTIAFLSSFAIVISSFVWRIVIYFLFDKSLAGLFFACFSIGSFPGTVFNTIIGPTFIKERIIISKFFKIILLFIFISILIIFLLNSYFVFNNNFRDYLDIKFVTLTISISLLGSFFMCYAMYLRHKKIQNSSSSRIYLFQRDIIYGSSITFIIPILYYIGNIKAVSFSFFLASLIALMIYSMQFNLKDSNNYNN